MRLSGVITVVLFSWVLSAGADLTGHWISETGKSKVAIRQEGSASVGKVFWLREPFNKAGEPRRDIKNPDPSRRSVLIVGMTILDLGPEVRGVWSGRVYSPEVGITFNCLVSLTDPNHLLIDVDAGLFRKKMHWTRGD